VTGFKKGTIYLILGWTTQLCAGYFLNFWLGRKLGVEGYGTYGVVMSILLWIEVGVISGLPTAIQKFVSANESRAMSIMKAAARIQFWYITIIFFLSFLAAPLIAEGLKDSNIAFYLRIAVLDVWIYGFFFMILSLQNGLHRFGIQAILIGVYGISKLAFVILLVSVMGSVTGAFVANMVGSAVGLGIGLWFVRTAHIQKESSGFEIRVLLKFAAPVALFSIVINLLLNVDLWCVKYFLEAKQSGLYVSASTIARIPYFIFFGLSATVLPVLSGALSENNLEKIKRTIQTAFRFLFLLAAPICVITLAYAGEIITVLFGQDFKLGGDILRILIWGMSLLAFFFLMTTIINADNRPVVSLIITGITLLIDIGLNVVLVPKLKAPGGAISTTAAITVGSIIAGIVIFKRFKTFFSIRTVLRGGAAAGLIYLLSQFIRVQGGVVIIAGCGLMILYVALLLLFGEISKDEILFFK